MNPKNIRLPLVILAVLITLVGISVVVVMQNDQPESGDAVAWNTYDQMHYTFKEIRACTDDATQLYHVYGGGGFGDGEDYVINDIGETIYYQKCDVAPADGCELVEERGERPALDTYECVSLAESDVFQDEE